MAAALISYTFLTCRKHKKGRYVSKQIATDTDATTSTKQAPGRKRCIYNTILRSLRLFLDTQPKDDLCRAALKHLSGTGEE